MTDTTNAPAEHKAVEQTTEEALSSPLEALSTTQPDNAVIAQINAGTLRYAKAGPETFVRRSHPPRRLDWYEFGVILLTVSSAAVCSGRLIWAIQP